MNGETAPEVPPTVAKIRELLEPARKKVGTRVFMDRMYNFAQELQAKYPRDFKKRRVYHALIGSTLPEGEPDVIEEDFPGEDSVVGFLKSLAQ